MRRHWVINGQRLDRLPIGVYDEFSGREWGNRQIPQLLRDVAVSIVKDPMTFDKRL